MRQEQTQEQVRRLLQPTHDANGWRAQVRALNAQEAVPLLAAALMNSRETPQARRQATTALGMLRHNSAVPALLQTLADDDAVLRARAAGALGQIEEVPDEVVQQLIHHLEDEDYFVRECCAKALAELRRADALPALEQMRASDSVPANREVADSSIETIRGITR